MSFVANKMTEEEYKYLDLEKHEKNLINIGKIKGKSELFLENRKLLENKLNDKLDNKNDEFFENILKTRNLMTLIFIMMILLIFLKIMKT